jgi:integrase
MGVDSRWDREHGGQTGQRKPDQREDRQWCERLATVKLEWVDFHVMRRTHASLMRERGIDPKVVADSMGHDVSVNLNIYTPTSLESRLQAVETLETAFVN